MLQGRELNRSQIPGRRVQEVGTRPETSYATKADVDAVQNEVDDLALRMDNADAAAALLSDRLDALEAWKITVDNTLADFETRITALENP